MPICVYRCLECGTVEELMVRRADETPPTCPCGGAREKDFAASLPVSGDRPGQARFDSRSFEARAYGCHPRQADAFNRRYGGDGAHWRKRDGMACFENARALDRYKKRWGHPV